MATLKQAVGIIKEQYDIIDVISEANIELTSSGVSTYKGLCPFHSEKTPSFVVNESFQSYRCFGCGASGDVITFIQETHGFTFIESVKFLAEGINLTIEDKFTKENKVDIDIPKLYELVEQARVFYKNAYDNLDNSHPAKQEVISRGLDPNSDLYGYAPEKSLSLYNYLRSKGYSEDLILKSELVGRSEKGNLFDFFRGRLLFTLTDFAGRPVSFSGRKLFETDNQAKYVNGKASPIFEKKATLFNFYDARKAIRDNKQAIVCEGQFDVLAMRKAGIENVVASAGTAFTAKHIRLIKQLVGNTGELLFAFDGDDAGESAADKVFKHFPDEQDISQVVMFPNGEDPCDVLVKHGAERLQELVKDKVPLVDFELKYLSKKYNNLDNAQDRYNFNTEVTINYLPLMTNQILIDKMMRQISVLTGIDIQDIRDNYNKAKNTKKTRSTKDTVIQEERLRSKPIDTLTDSDKTFIAAFSVMARFPALGQFVDINKLPDKFKPFMNDFIDKLKSFKKNNTKYKFIPEGFSQPGLAKIIMNYPTQLGELSKEEIKEYFVGLVDHAIEFSEEESRQQEKAKILRAINESSNNMELSELLKILENKNIIK